MTESLNAAQARESSTRREASDLPLSGVTVLDLTRLLPGPLAGLRLAEMGADVI